MSVRSFNPSKYPVMNPIINLSKSTRPETAHQLFKCCQIVKKTSYDLPFGLDMMTNVRAKIMATLKRDMFGVVGEAGAQVDIKQAYSVQRMIFFDPEIYWRINKFNIVVRMS